MPIASAFNKLATSLQPTEAGVSKGKLHVGTIKTRLSSAFAVNKALYIGSTARDTAIRGTSDVDLLVVLERKEARWGGQLINSGTFVNNVRSVLDDKFKTTEVRRDGQAIVVKFGKGTEPVDVVPAIFHEFRGGMKSPVYLIPNGQGDWMETAPEAHNTYLKKANLQSAGKLRRTTQLLKYWRSSRTSPLSLASIHLELLLASENICVGAKSYSRCLRDAFYLLRQREVKGLRDPLGVAGVLYAVQTTAQAGQLMSAVNYAADHSQRAFEAEIYNNMSEAWRQWNIVFNGTFPR